MHWNLNTLAFSFFVPKKRKKRKTGSTVGIETNQNAATLLSGCVLQKPAKLLSIGRSFLLCKTPAWTPMKKKRRKQSNTAPHTQRGSHCSRTNKITRATHTYRWLLNSTCRGRGHPRYVSHWRDHLRDVLSTLSATRKGMRQKRRPSSTPEKEKRKIWAMNWSDRLNTTIVSSTWCHRYFGSYSFPRSACRIRRNLPVRDCVHDGCYGMV